MNPPAIEFRAIYEAYFEFVWRSLRRLGVREIDTMDLTQKVFLTVHTRIAEFEGRSQMRTWLFGICRGMASDYRRSAPIRREIVTDVAAMDLQSDSHDYPLVRTESRQRAVLAETILNSLPEAQRVVFVLFELDEMSGEDIAALLNISVGTVRSRLRLARERFRREVKRLAAMAGHTLQASVPTNSPGRKEAV